MAENKVTAYPGVYDEDMNTELYLLAEEEITAEQYEAVKEGYGVTGPDFQVLEKDGKYYLKGDADIATIKATVNALIVDKGGEAVFTDDSTSDETTDETTSDETSNS